MKKFFFEKCNNEKGISLVELMVSVSIFSLVAIVSSGVFINSMKAQKEVTGKQNVTDNLRYILDFMIKELRTAQKNVNDPTLTFNNGDIVIRSQVRNGVFSKVSFENSFGDTIVYEFDSVNQRILRNNITVGSGDQSISSDSIKIKSFSLIFNDWDLVSDSNNRRAPYINILIKAESKKSIGEEVEMQSGVSPRIY